MSIYDQLPLSYIQQALMSQFGGAPNGGYVPISAALQQPAPQQQQSFYGPTHQALSQAFSQALQQQLAVPGLLAAMQADPAMASRIGGFGLQSYTPPVPKTGISWPPPPPPPPPAPSYSPFFGAYPRFGGGGMGAYDGSADGGTSADGTSGVGNDGSGSAAAAAAAAAAADAAASGNDGSTGVW